jgi:hypothetical protein
VTLFRNTYEAKLPNRRKGEITHLTCNVKATLRWLKQCGVGWQSMNNAGGRGCWFIRCLCSFSGKSVGDSSADRDVDGKIILSRICWKVQWSGSRLKRKATWTLFFSYPDTVPPGEMAPFVYFAVFFNEVTVLFGSKFSLKYSIYTVLLHTQEKLLCGEGVV